MRRLFSVDQMPLTSSLSQVTIRPGYAPLWVDRVDGEGILHAIENQHDRRGQKTCADCSPFLRRLRPLPRPRCRGQLPKYLSLPSPQMPRVGKTRKMMMYNTTKSRKGTSWSSRMDKRKNNIITENTVSFGELTVMVTD